MKTLEQQIAIAQDKLHRLHTKNKSANRKAEDHRKIKMGGVVIAAEMDDLDPAELAGWLLWAKEHRTQSTALEARENGLKLFAARELERERKKQGDSQAGRA